MYKTIDAVKQCVFRVFMNPNRYVICETNAPVYFYHDVYVSVSFCCIFLFEQLDHCIVHDDMRSSNKEIRAATNKWSIGKRTDAQSNWSRMAIGNICEMCYKMNWIHFCDFINLIIMPYAVIKEKPKNDLLIERKFSVLHYILQ